MWRVKSEAGKLRSVLVHDVSARSGRSALILPDGDKKGHIMGTAEEIRYFYRLIKEEGINVIDLGERIKGIVEDSDKKEKEEIIKIIWGSETQKPTVDELTYKHVLWGYPDKPTYDAKNDRIVFPDILGAQARFGIYARDPSFGTPIGQVICKMKRRVGEPKVVKLAMQRDPELKKNVDIVYDQNEDEDAKLNLGADEGGDHQVCNDEIIALGIGQRSNIQGFIPYMKAMFARDTDKQLKYICAVRMPGEEYGVSHSHLDTSFNFVDIGTAVVQPYIHNSDIVDIFPKKLMLAKLIDDYRDHLYRQGNRATLASLYTSRTFQNTSETLVYGRGKDGTPEKVRTEKYWIDFCIKEGLLDKDGIIFVAGAPKGKIDIDHLIRAQMEQNWQAPNIIQLRPGVIIAYEKNLATLENLEMHGIKVKKLPDKYIGLGGGPHCMTCPLDRDAI